MEEQVQQVVEKKEEDLPKSIVVILVVLAVAISILGTFTVLNEINRLNAAPVYEGNQMQAGQVSLTVINPNAGLATATGKVAFEVVKKQRGN